ncbi:IS5 family transposase (plasmid) [Leptospira weilii]|uniref:IS5 family transposase n=1 Tax=Leptospira weilii TaxID=28184 RepID=UPI001E29F9F4|nr:IS5 family transposase [Leptospira weilii]ULH27828.1 IS5 family transposase [Leptospira weilii]ULH28187.1 IS5 family transposase [Leptospira weilii]ULH29022.1 IS5 family transposase [Leptospira weilii]ULH29219.1 IS5 family transposase [Leptospira weilii]ULH29270.1 IS5 family transposase [Leptospira weilii]
MDKYYSEIPEGLWKQIAPLIPKEKSKPKGGRNRVPTRVVMAGIIYRMKTGCQWRAIPNDFGSGQTCHRRFQEWERAGVFKKIYKSILKYYDVKNKIAWDWASMDSAMVKAPKGGVLTGKNPTDRAKLGVKRHILTDGNGIPLAITLSGANVHDKRNVKDTLNSILVFSGRKRKKPKHLCLDKGYDFKDIEALIKRRNIRPHIRKKGEKPLIGKYKGKPRRWVVERTNSWHNRFRAILIRWERKAENYLASLYLASSIIVFNFFNR